MWAAGYCLGVQTRDLRAVLWDRSDLWLMMRCPSSQSAHSLKVLAERELG